jgi:NAD+ synthase (glutamine-hydrolysing)
MRSMRVGLAQINSTVGDFAGNVEKIIDAINKARSMEVDLLAFPELAICGYPPEDLLFKPCFLDENRIHLQKVVDASSGITVVVGFVDAKDDVYNAAAVISDGRLIDVYHKIFLPNYGVCDEDRYFRKGQHCPVYVVKGIGVGVSICEDIWYEAGPVTVQAVSGAEVLINISASPYHVGRPYHRGRRYLRESMVESRAADNVAIVVYTNLVGGQDDLVFDGNSIVVDETGMMLARGKQFKEDLVVVDLDIDAVFRARLQDPRWRKMPLITGGDDWQVIEIVISDESENIGKPPVEPRKLRNYSIPEEIYGALLLGTHDYVRKNGFEKVVIGMSGGVDSSLVAAIAVDALGPSNVVGVYMPSDDSSPESSSITKSLAEKLGIRLLTIPVSTIFQSYLKELVDTFDTNEMSTTEENIKARIRGNILMALSNEFNWLVLSASNKSELATGYSTSYGDIAGGFAVIKDVYKIMVYKLARYRNSIAGSDLLPATIKDKGRLAELKPHQWDQNKLPPFDLLDRVLTAYIEEDKNVNQIVTMGIDEEIVKQIAFLVDTSEYKRRQSPPGIKITPRAFGRDRRLPITNRFREQ